MKDKIFMFIIGLLVGAIIATGAFCIYTKITNTGDTNNPSIQMQGGQPPEMQGNQTGQPPEMPSGQNNESGQPPEKPSGDNNESGQQPPEKPSDDNSQKSN